MPWKVRMVFMNNKIIKTADAVKYNKYCPDFVCLRDGTLFGDYRYCQLSTKCRQVGYEDGKRLARVFWKY